MRVDCKSQWDVTNEQQKENSTDYEYTVPNAVKEFNITIIKQHPPLTNLHEMQETQCNVGYVDIAQNYNGEEGMVESILYTCFEWGREELQPAHNCVSTETATTTALSVVQSINKPVQPLAPSFNQHPS